MSTDPVIPDLARAQQALLVEVMSAISEECYCAGWLAGTEDRLWRAITDPSDNHVWGPGRISADRLWQLRWLSDITGGWVVWDDTVGPRWVPMAEWERRG